MKQLENKVALVTGGSRGIGAGIVKKLASQGAKVVFTYVNSSEQSAELLNIIRAYGTEGLAIQTDNASEGAITKTLTQTVEHFGKLDILVNNAGIYIGKPMEEHTLEDFNRIIAVNVRAIFEAAVFAAKKMSDGGRFITIGSNLADRVPGPQATLYAMSKSALIGLTKGLARDLGSRKITVNLVQPGPVNTDMNPSNTPLADYLRSMMAIPEYAHPHDIAALVAYLVSGEGKFVTGSTVTADGGFNA